MKSVCCPQCGATSVEQIALNKYACPYCGHVFIFVPQQGSTQPPVSSFQQRSGSANMSGQPPTAFYSVPQQQSVQQMPYNSNYQQNQPLQESATRYVSSREKVVAGILGIILGSVGGHKFYLGQIGKGIVYLIFCWTYIPCILGIIEGIRYLSMSDVAFNDKYNTY